MKAKEGRRFTPMFRPVTFLVPFGVVLVVPRSGFTGLCVIVYVRVASPLAKLA